jgi:plastocyanin
MNGARLFVSYAAILMLTIGLPLQGLQESKAQKENQEANEEALEKMAEEKVEEAQTLKDTAPPQAVEQQEEAIEEFVESIAVGLKAGDQVTVETGDEVTFEAGGNQVTVDSNPSTEIQEAKAGLPQPYASDLEALRSSLQLLVGEERGKYEFVCGQEKGGLVVNTLLTALTPILNRVWPNFALTNGIDPLTNVYDGSINLGCTYGGNEVCTGELLPCASMYANVDVSSITGLHLLQFEQLQASSVTSDASTPCSYSKDAVGPYICPYSGTGSGKASLAQGATINATLSSIEVIVECGLDGATIPSTVFKGSALCSATKPEGSAKFDFCAGTCPAESPAPANLGYGALADLSIKLGGLECTVSGTYNPAAPAIAILASNLKSTVESKVTEPIEKALNGLVADYVPFPAACPQ